nr:WTK6-vWA [Triticum aestivum]WDY61370.1 WTK6-vWA [Triticum aestivum]
MASPHGSDGAPKSEDLQLSSSSSNSSTNLSSSSSSSSSSSLSSRSSIDSTMGSKLQKAKRLSIEHLEVITDNFSQERVIGRGGFGIVYKGVHANGKNIAVKVLHKNMTGTDDGQFEHEFKNLMRLKHQNIVQLVGYCYETQHKPMLHEGVAIFADDIYKALCFEYMENRSLSKHISVECDGLEWHTRYKIIKGTCEGLKYLHEEFKEPIYHLDLKPDNILLDENMVPKLADFGSSKLFGKELTMVITQNFTATIGYMPPEFISHQIVSKKFDIFSLGVVMTKIIAGPRGNSLSFEMDYQDFLDQVQKNWRNRLQDTWHNSEPVQAYCRQVNVCIEIALSCMDADRNKRPSILDIIDKLNKTETVIEQLHRDHQWTSRRITMGDDKLKNEATPLKEKKSEKATEPTSLTIQVLKDITNNFAEERVIGRGAYGTVYMGKHENGEEIAVKLLYNNMQLVDDEQFENDFYGLMMLNHPNIVRLVGYCYETQHLPVDFQGRTVLAQTTHRALCLEYMHMGSLQRHLSDESSGPDWPTRYKIIKGTCEGLKYLHEGLDKPLYHLDLKPENILLDKNMMPKLADFGLTKLFGEEQTRVTHSLFGTMGYLPPEFISHQVVSKKFDIFSLGVVMTKIIAGPMGYHMSVEMLEEDFVDQVHEKWRNRMEATCTSSQTLDAYCEQVRICTKIGLSCVEYDRHKRPNILDIIDRLDETERKIEKALFSLSDSMHSWLRGDLLKLEAFTKSQEIPSTETCNEFPVLLRITGTPWCGLEGMPRAGVDVVVVVEVDWFMVLQWRLDIIKQALTVVIDKLGPTDRLSILSFEGDVPHIMKLAFMSDQGRDAAKLVVNQLTANHGYNIIAALRAGAEILRGRQVEKKDDGSRVGCIMFLSDNNDIRIKDRYDEEISSEFPAYVFGLGELHHPEVMKYIADRTRGTYSFVHYDTNAMNDAFELFMSGITKIAATSVKITLNAHDGVSISSIYSGGYNNHVSSDKLSGEIDIDNMYAGERKNFIVYLTVAEGSDNKFMTVGGRYRSFIADRELADTDVLVLRPSSASLLGNPGIHHEVAAELMRIQLLKGVITMGRNPDSLEQLWAHVKCSEEGVSAPEETLLELGNDVAEITRAITYNSSPPYMMSWLTCHLWQRATTKGARCVSGAFTIPGQHEDAKEQDDPAQ